MIDWCISEAISKNWSKTECFDQVCLRNVMSVLLAILHRVDQRVARRVMVIGIR